MDPNTRRPELEPVPPAVVPESREVASNRRIGSGRLTGRDADPLAPVSSKDPRERREPPLKAPVQRERTFDPPQRNDRNERGFPTRGGADPRDKNLDKDRRNYDRSSGYERDYGRSNRYVSCFVSFAIL